MKQTMRKRISLLIAVFFLLGTVLFPSENYAATKAKKITLNAATMTMYVGETYTLKVKSVHPSRASKAVYWKTSNNKIATISSKGKITAKKAGTVTITAVSKYNKSAKKSCTVTIKDLTVTFKTCFGELISEQTVKRGSAAITPEPPEIDGFEFYGWVPECNKVLSNMTCYALYKFVEKPIPQSYQVVFTDYDGSILKEETVLSGSAATPPENPERKGYIFIGWDKGFANVTSDIVLNAKYERKSMLPTFTGTQVKANKDSKNVLYMVRVDNNPGILGMTLKVEYDEKALTLTSAKAGSAVNEVLTFTKANVLCSGCKFVFDGQEIEPNEIKDGEVLILSFDVNSDAASGEYPINLSYDEGDIIDGNLSPLSIDITNGSIVVE